MERLTQVMKDQGLLQKGDILPGGSDNDTALYPGLFEELLKMYGPTLDETLDESQTTFTSYANLQGIHIRNISIGDKIFDNENYAYYGEIISIEYDEDNELIITTDTPDTVYSELEVITLTELEAMMERLQKYLKYIQA